MRTQDRILIVDDDKILSEHLKAGLAEESYQIVTVNKSASAIEEVKKEPFDLVLLDLVLPDIQGIDLLRVLSKLTPDASFIILTGYATISSAIEALKVGAYDYIIKPFDIDHLKLVIKRGLEKHHLSAHNQELLQRLEKEKVKLEIIMDAYNSIGSIYRLDELADFVTNRAVQIADAEKASLMVLDEKAQELVLRGAQGLDKQNVTLRIKMGDLIAGWVAREGQALLVSDIDTDPRFKLVARSGHYKTKSFISLPLKVDAHVIGVMNVTDKLAGMRIFTGEDLKYLTLLAHQTVTQIENIRLCEKLASLAVTDALTNVFNHRYFQQELAVELMRARRYKHALTLMILDVDGFKTYNDRYGHLEGDRVLKHVAAAIKQSVREVDIVCRYGGDEFVVILPFTNIKGARTVAEKIRQIVQGRELQNEESGSSHRVTISGGIAGYAEGLSRDELIAAADRALYKAKSEGKNTVCIAEEK